MTAENDTLQKTQHKISVLYCSVSINKPISFYNVGYGFLSEKAVCERQTYFLTKTRKKHK